MTEDEAKTKWCPFARNIGTLSQPVNGVETIVAHGTQNRGYQMGGALHNCLCIGSACMAWRQPREVDREKPGFDRSALGWKVVRSIDPDGPAPMIEWERLGPGFCGLAGSPA